MERTTSRCHMTSAHSPGRPHCIVCGRRRIAGDKSKDKFVAGVCDGCREHVDTGVREVPNRGEVELLDGVMVDGKREIIPEKFFIVQTSEEFLAKMKSKASPAVASAVVANAMAPQSTSSSRAHKRVARSASVSDDDDDNVDDDDDEIDDAVPSSRQRGKSVASQSASSNATAWLRLTPISVSSGA